MWEGALRLSVIWVDDSIKERVCGNCVKFCKSKKGEVKEEEAFGEQENWCSSDGKALSCRAFDLKTEKSDFGNRQC